jgi:hypothetical protein
VLVLVLGCVELGEAHVSGNPSDRVKEVPTNDGQSQIEYEYEYEYDEC